MTLETFESFQSRALAAGCDEVLERRWAPNAVVERHAHAFAVEALVTQGDLWLTCAGRERHLRCGDRFTLACDEPHSERYGPDGAVYWVARRNPR